MIKIYAETATKSRKMFKNDKIENHLKSVEEILTAVEKITGEKAWRTAGAGGAGSKLVIELSMGDENTDKIKEK